MMPHHIMEKAMKLKAFQLWELVEELRKDWEFLLSPKQIKDRVRTWVRNNLQTGFLEVVSTDPLIVSLSEYKDNWQSHLRYRTCPTCGKSFLPQKSQTLYCSPACASKEYAKRKRQKVKPPKRAPRKWTQEELERLRKEYQEKGRLTAQDLRELSKELGRSFKAVMHKYYEVVKR